MVLLDNYRADSIELAIKICQYLLNETTRCLYSLHVEIMEEILESLYVYKEHTVDESLLNTRRQILVESVFFEVMACRVLD